MSICVKFTMTTHQIWSCHVTLPSNSENFYFSPNSISNGKKSYQIWGKLAQEQKSNRQKTNWGGTAPMLIGLSDRALKRMLTLKRMVNTVVGKQS